MATRATHKAVFVVPELNGEIVRQPKFDYFGVSFGSELSAIYAKHYGQIVVCSICYDRRYTRSFFVVNKRPNERIPTASY